jgi:hypothetical protein
LTEQLGTRRAMLSVVLASAVVTYGGVSVFVAFFVLVPMAQTLARSRGLRDEWIVRHRAGKRHPCTARRKAAVRLLRSWLVRRPPVSLRPRASRTWPRCPEVIRTNQGHYLLFAFYRTISLFTRALSLMVSNLPETFTPPVLPEQRRLEAEQIDGAPVRHAGGGRKHSATPRARKPKPL